MKDFVKYWLPPLIWLGLIHWLSSIPGSELPQVDLPDFDKLAHAGIFGILCALIARAIHAQNYQRFSLFTSILLAVIVTILYGAIDEWHQSFTEGRFVDAWDLVADAFGALCCFGILTIKKIKPGLVQWAMT